MVTGFVDTTVLVDVIRKYLPAVSWLQAQGTLGITPIVWMELVSGAQNKASQLRALKMLARFEMIYLTQADMDWAMQQLLTHSLSHNVEIMDCLIASVSHRLQLPLYTHNLKHIEPILGKPLTVKPY